MPPIAVIRTERDVYANLLRDTRGLRREQANARDVWFASMPWERKEETLFELEMLLKGLACFGNPRNHPGTPAAKSAVAQDFHEELRILRDASQRVITLTKQLLGDKERAYTFTRYLESVLPEDSARGRLIQEQLTQDTPEEALFVLRNAFGHFLDLSDGLARLGRVSNRLYFAMHGVVVREIGRNAYFNPLMALEFRPEFDRIRSGEVLEALHAVESETAHRVLALTFLALFRALRYVSLVDAYASDPASTRRAYVILAVLRSDLRALTRYLGRRAGDAIADGLERELLATPSDEISVRYTHLADVARTLTRIRGTLDHVANGLRVEVKKIFEHDLPSPQAEISAQELGPQMVIAAAELRASLQNAVRALCSEIRPGDVLPELATNLAGRRAASDRLRREIWMFQQILRAFLAKADAAASAGGDGAHDRWAGHGSFQFVRDFLGHFRAIGYQLVRSHDYERLDPFLTSLERLRDVDLLEPHRMAEAVEECRALSQFLGELFEKVSSRGELAGQPFDRQSAGETLKIYLGRA
ncbi:hypothetical protein [Sandaracinus amylolyticus]|uniref:hypothetical protein n=1 Tax=Sandaracinus amylolyticus TaxID=927083 RepID=UPI001F3467D6|nr:hypothetical protein [Sandaracinus amylolyticus]UJR82660.1 Hypothetical protein I5071_47250 [Sandaracinus amylolyticus]